MDMVTSQNKKAGHRVRPWPAVSVKLCQRHLRKNRPQARAPRPDRELVNQCVYLSDQQAHSDKESPTPPLRRLIFIGLTLLLKNIGHNPEKLNLIARVKRSAGLQRAKFIMKWN
jgi:hypothetical protein